MENDSSNEFETSNETTETVTAEKPAKESKTPAWRLFLQGLEAEITALGLETEEQQNYVQVKHAETGHRIYLAKQDRAVNHIPTTMDISALECGQPFEGSNGKIAAEVKPDLESAKAALALLASGSFGKVRSSKRVPKAKADADSSVADASDGVPASAE